MSFQKSTEDAFDDDGCMNEEAIYNNTGFYLEGNQQINETLSYSVDDQGNINVNADMNDDHSSVIGLIQTIDKFIESLSSRDSNESKKYKSNPDHGSPKATRNFQTSQGQMHTPPSENGSICHYSSPNNISEVNNVGFRDKYQEFPGNSGPYEKIVTRDEVSLTEGTLDNEKQAEHDEPIRDVNFMSQQKRIGFPQALHQLLEEAHDRGYSDIVSWQDHGRSFRIIDTDRFVTQIMPRFFKQTKIRSFQRQLSLYGFQRITKKGEAFGSHCHESFLRGKPNLTCSICRIAVKGNSWIDTISKNIDANKQNTTTSDIENKEVLDAWQMTELDDTW